MEELARDPDIAPDLLSLLVQKVKASREALNASLKENAELRQEIAMLREETEELSLKEEPELVEEQLACQVGQYGSRDETESLHAELTDVVEKLEASEQAVEEGLLRISKIKRKYKRAKERLKEREDTIEELEQQLCQVQDEENQRDDSATSIPPSENASSHETDSESEELLVETTPHDRSPAPLDHAWLLQPCLPPKVFPSSLPKKLRQLMCKGGLLLWPSECCVVDFAKGIAMIYACQQRYMRWISDEEQRWSPNTVFAGFKGKQREFFYKSEENPEVILYAGTFEASRDTCVFDPMGYRNLPNNSRKHLLKSCILPSRSKPNVRKLSDDKKIIADKYWRGEAKVEYLQWTRIDFNMELFNGMLAFRAERMKGDQHDHKGTNKKRKSKQTNSSESSTRKKPRTETGL